LSCLSPGNDFMLMRLSYLVSPVIEDEKTLETLGKKLKKNAVAVDIVNLELANPEQNQKLQKFVDAVNSSNNR